MAILVSCVVTTGIRCSGEKDSYLEKVATVNGEFVRARIEASDDKPESVFESWSRAADDLEARLADLDVPSPYSERHNAYVQAASELSRILRCADETACGDSEFLLLQEASLHLQAACRAIQESIDQGVSDVDLKCEEVV
jgi:hypothetical protein